MSSKKIIILGGTGAIGSSLAQKIKDLNYDPILIAREKNKLKEISQKINCEYFECDV